MGEFLHHRLYTQEDEELNESINILCCLEQKAANLDDDVRYFLLFLHEKQQGTRVSRAVLCTRALIQVDSLVLMTIENVQSTIKLN